MKYLLLQITQYAALYRDHETGIAWVENGSLGISHSCHPNIHYTGSVTGMKQLSYWGKDDRTVRSHGWIYNIDICVVTDDLDYRAAQHCRCGGNHEHSYRPTNE